MGHEAACQQIQVSGNPSPPLSDWSIDWRFDILLLSKVRIIPDFSLHPYTGEAQIICICVTFEIGERLLLCRTTKQDGSFFGLCIHCFTSLLYRFKCNYCRCLIQFTNRNAFNNNLISPVVSMCVNVSISHCCNHQSHHLCSSCLFTTYIVRFVLNPRVIKRSGYSWPAYSLWMYCQCIDVLSLYWSDEEGNYPSFYRVTFTISVEYTIQYSNIYYSVLT